MKRVIIFPLGLVFTLLSFEAIAQDQLKIGHVDMVEIMSSLPERDSVSLLYIFLLQTMPHFGTICKNNIQLILSTLFTYLSIFNIFVHILLLWSLTKQTGIS